MVVALVTTDNRENFRQYEKKEPWFGTAPEALMQGFTMLPEVTVHVLSCTKRLMAAPSTLADNIYFHNLHVPTLGWMRTGYQGCIRAVRSAVRQVNADIVHGQGTERECAISAVFSGRPNAITIHGNMRLIAQVNRAAPLSYQWLAAKLERLTVPRSNGVVCITRYTERAVADMARRTWVIPNAVDATFFSLRRATVAPGIILCVGNIQLRKNQNAYIRALDVAARTHDFSVLFLGGADQKDPYVQEFLGLVAERKWCTFAGSATRTELKEHLQRATMLVLPSLEDNCPMVVLEAMAAGVPVMAANVGGVPELVKDGVTGLLCDPASAESMCGSTVRLLENADLAATLAAAGQAEAHARFHPRRIAEQHLEVYRELVSRCS